MKTLIFGLQYGDEAKGRVAAEIGKNSDWFIKFNGGPNSGHTVYQDDNKYALHHLGAGAVMSGKKIALDAGMVIDIDALKKEIATLPSLPDLYISSCAHVIQEKHRELDKNGSEVGSTKRGIGPCYADKALRVGKRIGDMVSEFWKNDIKATIYNGLVPFDPNDDVIFESNQAVMIDQDYGEYPFVTSSSVFPNGYYKIDKRIAVMKAYTTRVGKSRILREKINWLTVAGSEYGTTTNRPRECFWNDINELNYAISLSNPDEICITKMDIIKDKEIKIVNKNNRIIDFKTVESYIDYLVSAFPKIKYLSWAPQGELQKIK